MSQKRISRPIQVMPPELQNQIAAGEVVERPASVLKELMENSLDAGATKIRVCIEQGGQSLLEVQDNGCGMTVHEMELALTRHATSKITHINDLFSIESFGFRGEALPAIAAVSHLTIASVPEGGDEAFSLELETGKVVKKGPAALPCGTKITVQDIFVSLPARLKFLKTPATETRRCQDVFFRLALTRLDVEFSFTSGGRQVFDMKAGESLSERLGYAWPPAITQGLMPFDLSYENYRIHGLTGDPARAQSRADRILFYVAGRPVQDKLLMQALRQAYAGRLLSREYPQSVIFIELPPQEVDINVHPAKTEIRFRNEKFVFSAVRRAILSALEERSASPADSLQSVTFSDAPLSGKSAVRPGFNTYNEFKKVADEQPLPLSFSPMQRAKAWLDPDEEICEPPQGFHNIGEKESKEVQSYESQTQWQYLGQLANTYLILSDGKSLSLVDQHAAHERVLFHGFEKALPESQPLAIALEMVLHPAESQRLQDVWQKLHDMGFVLQSAENKLLLKSIPALFGTEKAKEYLQAVLSSQAKSREDLWAMLSCRAAIKAGESLAREEALALIHVWSRLPNPDYCPHGRPIRISWGINELEKLFKRKV